MSPHRFSPATLASSPVLASSAPALPLRGAHRAGWRLPLLSLALGLTAAGSAAAADLEVIVDVKAPPEGKVMIAVYDSAANFRKTELVAQSQPATAGPLRFRFPDLKPGDYAVAMYLDRNGNGKLDTNLVGMPTEPYAFSREPKGRFAPPSWDDVKITVPETGSNLTIRLGD